MKRSRQLKNHSDIWDIVEEKSPAYFDLSDTVWDNPETNYEEYKASDAHAQMLMDEGFRVEL
ncbi:amidohydrolase, partial [Ochrobactrum sp. SFR4]|nr:amidohydrolase [Ochrobactrum sp. SFR4]